MRLLFVSKLDKNLDFGLFGALRKAKAGVGFTEPDFHLIHKGGRAECIGQMGLIRLDSRSTSMQCWASIRAEGFARCGKKCMAQSISSVMKSSTKISQQSVEPSCPVSLFFF